MENPSPTEEGQGKESTAAGPSGTRDDDDSPITVQGDNISNPPHGYRNVRQRLDPQNPADTTSDDESARIGTPSTSPSPSPPAFQQDVSTSTLAAQAVHAGASYPPGNYYQPIPLHGAQFPPGHHPSGLYYYAPGTQSQMPPNVQSPPQGIHHQPGILPPSHDVQNPLGGGGRARGRWRASPQTVPELIVDIHQTVDAVTQTILRQTVVSVRQTFQVVLEPEPEPQPIPIPIPIPSSDDEWRRLVGAKCPVCERDLVDQPGILPATASPPCGHVFHADCLKMITPEGSSNTPIPCAACPSDSDNKTSSSS